MKFKLKMILGGILCVTSAIVLADGIVYCPNKLPAGKKLTSLTLGGKSGYILDFTFLPVDTTKTNYSFLKAEINKDNTGVWSNPQCWYISSDTTTRVFFGTTPGKDLKLKPTDDDKFKNDSCDASYTDCSFTPSDD